MPFSRRAPLNAACVASAAAPCSRRIGGAGGDETALDLWNRATLTGTGVAAHHLPDSSYTT